MSTPEPTGYAAPTLVPAPESDAHPGSGLRFHDVVSGDGTRLRAWSTNPVDSPDAPVVLLCNGLGTNPYTWPALLRPDAGVRVVSWYHRGVGGSERPAKRTHVHIEHFVDDAIAVLDAFGIDAAPVMGWSMGVNTMFELAATHPERVTGLFAVAGVPGRTFSTMLRPLRLPNPLNELITVNLARVMKYAGPLTSPIAAGLPMGPRSVWLVSHSGFMLPLADPKQASIALRDFLSTPQGWYMHLALRTHRHQRVSLSRIAVPTWFVAATWDLLAGAKDMRSAADRIPDARYVELPGSHFIAMEKPDEVHVLLQEFLDGLD
ncbi:alpha/beta fold hydrolase [Nocardioides limicola]|uniref:alpha/beta fold hydrolase n=1 Tax=Nocardioides limicola TaxID=2803368 RepID=UPI00193BACE3|nr:alpha/beta hydrolase [Nocardioides sp. DJM-14]